MKLISEEKINSQVEKYATRSSLDWLNFIDGAYFAEKELENLAKEFVVFQLDFNHKDGLFTYKYLSHGILSNLDIEQLFEKFLEQRKKS